MKVYNLYCDESCHLEHDGQLYMLLSYTKVLNNRLEYHEQFVKDLKEKHHFYGEIKWTKVSKSKYEFYEALIDHFFQTDLSFKAIVIEKDKIKNRSEFDNNEFYYRMYHQLLYYKLDLVNKNKYNIYNDFIDTRSSQRLKNLKETLQTQLVNIGNFQNIQSKESIFIQITDLIMGAVSYYIRGSKTVTAKNNIISKIIKYSNHDLKKSTNKTHEKFNLYYIELGNLK